MTENSNFNIIRNDDEFINSLTDDFMKQKFPVAKIKNELVKWIRQMFQKNGGEKAIIGISGGKDSSVVAALCAEALGKENVIGVLMPNGVQRDISVSYKLVEFLGIPHMTVDISNAVYAVYNDVHGAILNSKDEHINYTLSEQARINLPARIRMATLYAISQSNGGRVINTCNLSEDYIGYSTRYGDSVGDFAPLADFTTDEVIQIGKACHLPDEFVYKTPTDGLSGKTDEDNFGFSYQVLNHYIRTGICESTDIKEKIDALHTKNAFKLKPMPKFVYRPEDTEEVEIEFVKI